MRQNSFHSSLYTYFVVSLLIILIIQTSSVDGFTANTNNVRPRIKWNIQHSTKEMAYVLVDEGTKVDVASKTKYISTEIKTTANNNLARGRFRRIHNNNHAFHNGTDMNNAIFTQRQQQHKYHKRKKKDEYQWLSWLHHEWLKYPVGQVDEKILNYMLPAMNAYAKQRTEKACQHAEAMLDCYIQEYLVGTNPYLQTLNVTIFTAVIDSYAQIGNVYGAKQIWNKMIHLQKYYDKTLQPDIYTYTALANAYAKCRSNNDEEDAAKRTMIILKSVEENNIQPTNHLYNIILQAIYRNNNKEINAAIKKVEQAEKLIKRMRRHSKLRPDRFTYLHLISIYSKANQPQKAENILKLLKRLSKKNNNKDLIPNTYCYTAVINAWAYSNDTDKAQRAYNVIQEMIISPCRPNTVAFTAAMNACTSKPTISSAAALSWSNNDSNDNNHNHKNQSVMICKRLMNELRQYDKPNFLTYATYINVIATSLVDIEQKDIEIKEIFQQCCNDGQVGNIVLRNLHIAASKKLYNELLSPYYLDRCDNNNNDSDYNVIINRDSLPLEWTYNVQGER